MTSCCIIVGIDSGIVVTWITFYSTSSSQVRYALHGNKTLDRSVVGVVSSYKDGDTTRFVHRVTLQDLQPNTKYGIVIMMILVATFYDDLLMLMYYYIAYVQVITLISDVKFYYDVLVINKMYQ